MHKIGIDVGSTYTKYCVLNEADEYLELYSEKTPIRQREYFEAKIDELYIRYPDASVITCGYGRKNIASAKNISELTALAIGCHHLCRGAEIVLDIGGQDTKIICQEDGKLKEFFINDKCAAGSGMFLESACKLLEIDFRSLDLTNALIPEIRLSSVCAVFAQSEIVELIADNTPPDKIINAVIWNIFIKSQALLSKVKRSDILLSGGLASIPGIERYAGMALETNCITVKESAFMSAIGCAVSNAGSQ